MATFRKNLAVGMTMIVALVLLAAMILRFGDAPVRLFQRSKIEIYFDAQSAEGMSNGSPILYRGVNVGMVTGVQRLADQSAVRVIARVESQPPLPANLQGFIKASLIGGSTSLSLEVAGDRPEGQLKAGDRIPLQLGGSTALPREFTELAKRLTELSRKLETTVEDLNQSKMIYKVAQTVDTVREAVSRAGDIFEDVRRITGDEKLRQDLRDTLTNVKSITENARVVSKNLEAFSGKLDKLSEDFDKVAINASSVIQKTGANVDDLSKQLSSRLLQVAKVLEHFQSISNKIDRGDGTAGKFVNDPKLYQALVESSQELALTIKDLRRLVEQWEQEGVSFKLGGKK